MFTVKQLMHTKDSSSIFSVLPTDTVIHALQVMADKNVGAVLVEGLLS